MPTAETYYIINLKRTSKYKVANFWINLKGQITPANFDGKHWIFKYKRLFRKIEFHETCQSQTAFNILS